MEGSASARIADQIRADYEWLEPGQGDAWNPLASEFELFYRLSLLHATTHALRRSPLAVSELELLDLGCGNGRSTRMYIDLGLRPEQLTGIDVRPGAIELAQRLNPAVRFELYEGEELPFPERCFSWVHLSTVMSSVRESNHRRDLVERISRRLAPGGCVFYFDLVRANEFAGHDLIRPEALFAGFRVLERWTYESWRFMQELEAAKIRPLYLTYCRLKTLLFPLPPSHEAVLFARGA